MLVGEADFWQPAAVCNLQVAVLFVLSIACSPQTKSLVDVGGFKVVGAEYCKGEGSRNACCLKLQECIKQCNSVPAGSQKQSQDLNGVFSCYVGKSVMDLLQADALDRPDVAQPNCKCAPKQDSKNESGPNVRKNAAGMQQMPGALVLVGLAVLAAAPLAGLL